MTYGKVTELFCYYMEQFSKTYQTEPIVMIELEKESYLAHVIPMPSLTTGMGNDAKMINFRFTPLDAGKESITLSMIIYKHPEVAFKHVTLQIGDYV